ncbi:hypothetical protein ACFFU8_08905 [Chromobacterium piscinae]|uniref:hypothetical protein n=1 Tax=Chromobacterium piscinae TaxID=686831 RepID=UPI001E5E9324|nr:hypothetical protein [Chromobacterium piscinae]MCD5327977.1 hypothetical protein [Chromobacterium piscinae]
MPFLFLVLFAMYAHMITVLRAIQSSTKVRLLGLVHLFSSLIAAYAVLFGFGLFDDPKRGISLTSTNWSVPLFFAFGVLTLALFGYKIFSTIRTMKAEQYSGGVRFGLLIWVTMAGLYITGTVFDHWWFFRDPQHAGVAAVKAMGVTDVPCDGFVLVRIDKHTAYYRCPEIVFGSAMRSWPFSPWPSYQAGESTKLKYAIEQLQEDARTNSRIER